MKKVALSVIFAAIALAAQPASAAPTTTEGFGALSLATVLAQHDPLLTVADRALLAHYLAGYPQALHHAGLVIHLNTGAIACRAGDVDLAMHECTIKLGAHTMTLTGRNAHELYATMVEAGIPSDGAAGSIYESVNGLQCVIQADQISDESGDGAVCTYTQ
jgi:hypothetical protein